MLKVGLFLLLWSISFRVYGQSFPSKKSGLKLFENATIVAGKTPVTLRGISGGTKETQSLAQTAKTETGECIGFIDSESDHEITLSQQFNFLRLAVKSPGDTVLLVKGPGGTWCSDDSTDRNPLIEGQWLPGIYQIWVGSYVQNNSFPYVLEISETP